MSEETGRMADEDKFLGVRTTIEPPAKATEEAQQDLDIEVLDDRPQEDQRPSGKTSSKESGDDDMATDEEIAQYGKRAHKRIKKLKWEYHEERRAKEQEQRLASEAVDYSKTLQTENQRLLRLVQDSQKALNEHSQYGASTALQMAEAQFKTAHESGDSEQIASAQKALTNAQLREASASNVSQQVINNWKQEVMRQEREVSREQAQQPVQEAEPDPQAVEWSQQNEWFGNDKEMTSFAYGVHEKLVGEDGVDPNTQEYYQLVDKRMREVFPDYFGTGESGSYEQVVVDSAPRRRTSPVVAPATRNSGAAPRKVTLTQTQVALAKRLGLTPQQYATQLIKERN
tara:strand:+ start:1674 stop:2702 length:1029 start_codon:yes stop_codon:yes gene_type:complete